MFMEDSATLVTTHFCPSPKNVRGRLLTMDEVKQVGAKDELLERATILENDSRGWFEDDEELAARLAEVRYISKAHGLLRELSILY